MKRILYCILALTLMSCADDLGNYDYEDLQEVKIGGIEPAITALAYQKLSVPVTLTGASASADRYEYQWEAIKQFKVEAGDQKIDTLATTKDLDEIISLPPGAYKLVYTVKDKERGVFYRNTSDLQVVTTTSEGWLVLSSENGNTRLDMVSLMSGEEIYSRNILAESEMPYRRGPRALIYLNPGGQMAPSQVDPLSPFYLLTDEGATRLHRDAFAWKPEYDVKYEMGDVHTPAFHHIGATGYYRMAVDGTDVYYSDYGGAQGLYGSPLNYIRAADFSRIPFRAAPYVGCDISAMGFMMRYAPTFMFYDLDNKQFVCHKGGMYSGITGDVTEGCAPLNDDEIEGDAFEFPVGYNYVYMENTKFDPTYSGTYSTTYTILDDGTDYRVYGIMLGPSLL